MAGVYTSVRGDGSVDTPFQVDVQPAVAGAINFVDGQTIDFTVTGFGSQQTPLSVTAEAKLAGMVKITTSDTDIAVAATGAGTPASPLSFDLTLPWIDSGGGTKSPGDVLIRDANGIFKPGQISVSTGTIYVRPGMMGDGSIGNPLGVDLCTYADMKSPRLCARGAAQNGMTWPAVSGVTGETANGAVAVGAAGFVAVPVGAWTTGQHITIETYRFYWNGTAWRAGVAP